MAMLNNQRVYGGHMTSDDRGRSGNPPHLNIPTGPKKFTSHGFLGSIIAMQTVSNKLTNYRDRTRTKCGDSPTIQRCAELWWLVKATVRRTQAKIWRRRQLWDKATTAEGETGETPDMAHPQNEFHSWIRLRNHNIKYIFGESTSKYTKFTSNGNSSQQEDVSLILNKKKCQFAINTMRNTLW